MTNSEIPNDLEEAADEYKKRVIEETKCHHNALTYAQGYEDALLLIPDAFIDGAKWDREEMLKDAVEGEIIKDNRGNNVIRAGVFNNGFDTGDKVRIIIVKED